MAGNEAGSFCWVELATPDPAGAETFYKKLLGWEAQQPSDAKQMYTLLALKGEIAAGCFQLPEELRKQGVPPHWLLYVATPDADHAARRAKELGGRIVREPFDAQDVGRLAVIQDPAGAVFGIWQAKRFTGLQARDKDNAFCWGELIVDDTQRAERFYGDLFGWKISHGAHDSSGYLHISNGETAIGGVPPAGQREANVPPHWLAWFSVADTDAAVEDAVANHGRVLASPYSIEGVGRMSVLQDPQGARLALIAAERR